MRFRVALAATLLNLLICLALLTGLAISARNTQNDIIKEELAVTCRLTAEVLEAGPEAVDKGEYLRNLDTEKGMEQFFLAYIEKDGSTVFTSFVDPPPENVNRLLTSGEEIKQKPEATVASGGYLVATKTLEDGTVIALGKRAVSFSAVMGKGLIKTVPFILLAVAVQYYIVMRYVGRSDKLMAELMSVLEDFTEGRFSSRITNVEGFSTKLATKYNATLARVQDRVFRQVRRNRVLGQMLNQMHNGLITVDTDLNVTFANSNAGKLFGKDVKNAEGRPLKDVFDNEDLEELIGRAISESSRQVYTGDTESLRANGGTRPLRMYTSSMFSEGKCTGALVVVEDITEIRNLEQVRTDFAANVSHEMKTPLTSIKGFIETLQAGAIDNPETARRFLGIMELEADRLNRLINDILSITKLESGNDSVEIKRLNLMDVIKYVALTLLKPQAESKEVTVTVHNPETPVWVMGNRDRVQQLILNIVENGIKYNKTGGKVDITVIEDTDSYHLIIADTGIGIKEEHLSRLFERFYRVDKGRSREMGGTGLGLAICKHIVNTMNGYIEVNSKYGEGTEFLVTLPKAPEEEEK
ncbi:MAG: PAS domain S-box protein [Clostridia bacterium]|nr:PAS domain S-box protein [Clostridia bacterium]